MRCRILIVPTLLLWILLLSAAMGHPLILQFTGHIFKYELGDFRRLL